MNLFYKDILCKIQYGRTYNGFVDDSSPLNQKCCYTIGSKVSFRDVAE